MCSSAQASTQPGTLIGSIPCGGIVCAIQLRQLRFHLLVAQAERRAAAAVQAVELVLLRAVDDREEIAADAVRDRLHQSERGVGRDRGVDRAAAALQNVESDLRRERHAGADHAVARDDFGTRGKRFAGDAIDLGRQSDTVAKKNSAKKAKRLMRQTSRSFQPVIPSEVEGPRGASIDDARGPSTPLRFAQDDEAITRSATLSPDRAARRDTPG